MKRLYPSDLTDEQWDILLPLLPPAKPGGRPALVGLVMPVETLADSVQILPQMDAGRNVGRSPRGTASQRSTVRGQKPDPQRSDHR